MRNTLTILALSLLLGFAGVAANAQTVTPKVPSKALSTVLAPSVQEIAESGQLVDGVYSNASFGFKVAPPKGWNVAGDDLNRKVLELGRDKITANESPSTAKALDRSYESTRILFTSTFRHDSDVPSVGILLCGIEKLPAEQAATQYAEFNKQLVLRNSEGAKVTRDLYSKNVGGVMFTAFELSVPKPGVTFQQTYLIMMRKNYAFFFITTYNDNLLQESMLNALDTLTFQTVQ